MVSDGMLDDAEPFEDLMGSCADLEQRANETWGSSAQVAMEGRVRRLTG